MPDAPPRRRRHRGALVLAALGLLLCWIPWAGLALSVIALGVAARARRRGARVGWAAALGVWGLLLGILFTGAVALLPPAEPTATDQRTWEDFERAFEDDARPAGGAEGGGEGSAAGGSAGAPGGSGGGPSR
ncbi:MAG TPA: hypothetical protein VN033_07775 [Vulgatibacter sp.]|nr:hypothetical protein [Vulgatibacter sp.]